MQLSPTMRLWLISKVAPVSLDSISGVCSYNLDESDETPGLHCDFSFIARPINRTVPLKGCW